MHLRKSRFWSWIRKIPRRRHLRGTVLHRWLGDHIFLPCLWKPERASVASGVGVGLFCAMLPIPFQMVPAGLAAFFCRVNIPAAVTSVWVTNPLTWPVILFWQYKLGAAMIGGGAGVEGGGEGLLALVLGCLVTGVFAGVAGWLSCQLLWSLLPSRTAVAVGN